jgi:hypothetical protein
MGTVTDAAGRTGAARPTDLTVFHDAGELISVTDLAGLNGFAGFTGGNKSTRLLGSTSLYGPSTPFSVVDTANSADASYLVDFAGSTNGSGLVGFPNGEGSNWFPDSSETAGFAGFNGLSSADGLTNVGGLTNVDGLASVDGLTSVDGFVAVDGTDVGGCTTVGTFTTDDAFDWFTSGSMFNDFGSVDTSTGL